MHASLAIATALAAALVLAAPARSDVIADAIATMPPEVEDVRMTGSWEREDGERGVYRLVVAREGADPVVARLFVQWLAFDAAGGLSIDHSVEVTDVAELGGDIAGFRSESDTDGLAIYIDLIGAEGQATDTYELFMFSPTDYLFGPATN